MISVVNLLQAALLAVAVLGLCLLRGKKQHQGFIGLLLLVVLHDWVVCDSMLACMHV